MPHTWRRSRAALLASLFMLAGTACTERGNDQELDISAGIRDQLAALAIDPAVRAAFDHAVAAAPGLRDVLIELTEIPAPPFGEQLRAQRFAELLRDAGLDDVSIDAVGNVIGVRPGRTGEKTIALLAHLDTVFPAGTDLGVRTDGDTYYAPGIGDNSRGLVTILSVLRAMQHAALATDATILFIGNVGEEGPGDLRGVRHLFRDGAAAIDTVIAVDGGNTNRLVWGGVGSHRYRVTYRGPGGHSWGAFGTANPHHALGRAIALFDTSAAAVTRSGPKTTYNIGRVGGGTSVNSIPFESWMDIDLRSGSQQQLERIDAVLQSAIQQALDAENAERSEGDALTVAVERTGTRPASRGKRSSPLVQRAAAAMQHFGLEPELSIASTDANYPLSIGVPAITLSRGGISSNTHSPAESWQDKDAHVAVRLVLLTLIAEAGI